MAQQEGMESESEGARTRARIVDLAEALLMESGFNAISYQDVAERIGIRKASIHYHFPSKADLGTAVIARYVDRVVQMLVPPTELDATGVRVALETFMSMFAQVAASPRKVCLGAMFGAEYETLPEGMRAEVARFYRSAQGWMAGVLERGRALGVMGFDGPAEPLARAIVALMEGALIVERVQLADAELESAKAAVRRLAGLAHEG